MKIILIIYKFLPWRLRKFIMLFLYFFRENRKSNTNFPLVGKKTFFSIISSFLDKPLKFENDDFDYYSKVYNDARQVNTDLTDQDVYHTAVEVVPGKQTNQYKFNIEEKSVFMISRINISQINIEVEKKNNKKTFDLISANNRFISFLVESNTKLEIKSKEDFIVSPPIMTNQKIKNKKKMVLFLFVDGLVDRSILQINSLKQYMPYSAKFFSNAFDFRNHHANSDWTLPSFASIFSGRYLQSHNFYDPNKTEEIGKTFKILSQYFKKEGYSTFSAGGNPRISPSHGYVKGFDRTIYNSFMPASEVIGNFLEHNFVFNQRDQFHFLQFNDLHHDLSIVPDFSVMSALSPDTVKNIFNSGIKNKNIKSIWNTKDDDKKMLYLEKIKRLDSYLNIIYQYLNDNYETSDITVCLAADHGHSYLSDDVHPLSLARTKAIWLLKSGDKKGVHVNEFTESVDIFNTVLSDSGIDFNDNIDGNLPIACGGKIKRDFSFSQSLYEGQTYKAVINSDHGRYTYESKTKVRDNGVINHESPTIIINKNPNAKNYFTEEQIKKIVINKIKKCDETF